MKYPIRGALALATLLALMAGCETTSTAPEAAAPVETRSMPAAGATAKPGAATATGAPQSQVASVDLGGAKSAGATALPLAGGGASSAAIMAAPRERLVFFDFDSYVIKDEFKGLLDGQAKTLASNRGRRMTVEGHTDERGGREYNLALGQKRAEAVVRSLTLLGASTEQLEAVSFGEERPIARGADEVAWARNRRAELKDR